MRVREENGMATMWVAGIIKRSTRRNLTPRPIVMEEGAKLGGYRMTTVDHMIILVYGEYLQQSELTHLYRGVYNDVM